MAYQDDETGLTTGRPVELYKFVGTYKTYLLTSYSEEVTSGGEVYTPVPISRNKLKIATQDKTENALEVSIPFDHQMVVDYAYQNVPPDLTLTLYRAHASNFEDKIVAWEGRVTAFAVEDRTAKLKVPAVLSYILNSNAPSQRYQAPCNHVLYDARCGIDPTLHQHVSNVTAFQNNVVSLGSNPYVSSDILGGVMISPSGEQRMIISCTGNDITVTYPFANLTVGQSVTVRKGCDHAFNGDCKNKFNNGSRFGGFPIVPDRNPFTSSLS